MNPEAAFKPTAFGWFERVSASFCMGIPGLLIVAEFNNFWLRHVWAFVLMVIAAVFVIVAPLLLKRAAKQNQGWWLARFGIGAFVLMTVLVFVLDLEPKKSISAYVGMRDPFIFGMLLGFVVILFMANCIVYWNADKLAGAQRRKWLNGALAIALTGVIIYPCNDTFTYPAHMTFAALFFAGCALGTVAVKIRSKDEEPVRSIWEFAPAIVMLVSFALWKLYDMELLTWAWLEHLTLFGVESMALWIVGVDFVFVSLQRDEE
jgi:hypothetical protein